MSKKYPIYYFGCGNRPGHYMHAPGMRTGGSLAERRAIGRLVYTNPWGTSIDGGLCLRGIGEREGIADLHQKDDWTAVAFWDRSVDHRPGSNSVFLVHGLHDFDQVMEMARQAFPTVFARFGFEVRAVRKGDT